MQYSKRTKQERRERGVTDLGPTFDSFDPAALLTKAKKLPGASIEDAQDCLMNFD